MKLEELEKEIERIKNRNSRVENDKAWETSFTRRILIIFLTYFTMVVFFYFAKLPKPFVNSIVPSLAFLISTFTLNFFKSWWINRQAPKKDKHN